MALTSQLGIAQSQPGNVELGILGTGIASIAVNIRVKRGSSPTTVLADGEPGWNRATKTLWVGDTGSNYPAWPANQMLCCGRLTLSSSLAVSTADISGATTLYFLPYSGNTVAVYAGSYWSQVGLGGGGYSLSLSGVASGSVYDVYLDWASGTPALGLSAAWTNTTTRATAFVVQDGVLCIGVNTRRYLGTIYGSASGQVSDTATLRGMWNYRNRVQKHFLKVPSAANWTYTTTSTWRQAGNDANNQVALVQGLDEDALAVTAISTVFLSSGAQYLSAFGVDSLSPAAGSLGISPYASAAATQTILEAVLTAHVGQGYHYLPWLEYTASTAASTPQVIVTTAGLSTGIYGTMWG